MHSKYFPSLSSARPLRAISILAETISFAAAATVDQVNHDNDEQDLCHCVL